MSGGNRGFLPSAEVLEARACVTWSRCVRAQSASRQRHRACVPHLVKVLVIVPGVSAANVFGPLVLGKRAHTHSLPNQALSHDGGAVDGIVSIRTHSARRNTSSPSSLQKMKQYRRTEHEPDIMPEVQNATAASRRRWIDDTPWWCEQNAPSCEKGERRWRRRNETWPMATRLLNAWSSFCVQGRRRRGASCQWH